MDYNVELFARMYFHLKHNNYPTILFFRTGSYTIMGGKQMDILDECEAFVKKLIHTFDKTSMVKYQNRMEGDGKA